MLFFFGTGMITADLKQAGTIQSWSDQLKMEVRIGVSWSAQCFNVADDRPSGPAAFLGFCLRSNSLTPCSLIVGAESPCSLGKEGGLVYTIKPTVEVI